MIVPDDVGSGLIKVFTPYGSAAANSDFIVPPPGYSLTSIASTTQVSENGGSTNVSLGVGQVALVLFNGTQGDQYVRAAIQPGVASATEVLDPHGNVIASGCASNCLYALPTLSVTGTYTVVMANPAAATSVRVTIATPNLDSLDLDWDNAGNNLWTRSVNLSVAQLGILSFSGTAGQLTQVGFRSISNNWTLSLLNSSGQTLWSASLNSSTSLVSIPALPANGSYSLVFDPELTGGSLQYVAGVVASGALTVNGSAVTINGGGPNNIGNGAAAEVTFAGTAGQNLILSISASQGFFYNVEVNPLTMPFLACPGGCSSGIEGGTCTYRIPTLNATGTYVVYIGFESSLYSTVSLSLATSGTVSACSGPAGLLLRLA